MPWPRLVRSPLLSILAAALLALAGVAVGLPSVVAAMIGAAVGAMAMLGALPHAPPEEPAAPATGDVSRPAIEELIEAITDPVLLVERQLVTRANGPALELLGAHIVGSDVRMAIRHPAAAERLVGPSVPGAVPAAVELVGVGTRERRWEMVVHDLPGGARMVRLDDRTGAYAIERMRVDFVANASHELRTPLSTLIGFIEALEEVGDERATRSRFLKIMADEARRMQRLVEDLMSLSRIEAGKYSLPRDDVALPPLVDEVRNALRTGMVPDAERIVVAVSDGLPAVQGDRAQLSQLLYNLIGNAAKYGRPGTPIHVFLQQDGAMIRLAVEDEGDGIAPEHLPRLTERFYRADPSRSRALGGTGLGLAIVKHIVERHRGRLDIASELGRGTRVTVLLPAATAAVSSNCHANVTESDSGSA
jgi:two-component system phosphate regulon sensor histidine kinase PhoR